MKFRSILDNSHFVQTASYVVKFTFSKFFFCFFEKFIIKHKWFKRWAKKNDFFSDQFIIQHQNLITNLNIFWWYRKDTWMFWRRVYAFACLDSLKFNGTIFFRTKPFKLNSIKTSVYHSTTTKIIGKISKSDCINVMKAFTFFW